MTPYTPYTHLTCVTTSAATAPAPAAEAPSKYPGVVPARHRYHRPAPRFVPGVAVRGRLVTGPVLRFPTRTDDYHPYHHTMTNTETPTDTVVPSSENCSEPNYSAVDLPSKDRTEYSYVERRAELLQLITEAGHPRALNQGQVAERYGVSQQQISKDIDRIARHVRATVGDRGRRALVVDTTVQRAIRGLLDDGEYRKAARTAIEWDEWATEFTDLERLQAEIDQLKERQEDTR